MSDCPHLDLSQLIEYFPSLKTVDLFGYNFYQYLKTYMIDSCRWAEKDFKDKTLRDIISAIIENEKLKRTGANRRKDAQKGGKADKQPKAFLVSLEKKIKISPKATAKELFDLFPDEFQPEYIDIGKKRFEIYFDEADSIVQKDDKTGKDRKIGFDRFQKYVTEIRKKIKKK